ncbi:MAG TPA: hypothetical protein VLH56_08910 [Dissulfurispiraceae bacterium]|nr:hypothetical protein [Dissulfurispiraceae bacterium]
MMPKKQRVPMGEGLHRTPQQLDELSRVTEEDILAAKAWVDSNSPLLGRILDAKLIEDDDGDQAQPD